MANQRIKFYQTELASAKVDCPQQLMNKSAEEIVKYLMIHFKMNDDERGIPVIPANMATAYMKAVSDAVFDPKDWKGPMYAKFANISDEWIKAAIIWYHGAKPIASYAGVYSYGYAC